MLETFELWNFVVFRLCANLCFYSALLVGIVCYSHLFHVAYLTCRRLHYNLFTYSRLGHYIISRKKGDRSVRVGDVVVFNFPYSKGEEQMRMNFDLYFCKRCVAIPGETYIWEWDAVSDSVYLPRQEEVVVIDSLNFRHYNRCIEYETGIMPKLLNGTVMHADTLMHSYRFKNNYYFMRGDNCVDSYDSRFWGILPEDFILGTGQFIWFSKDRDMGKIRWERMFRKL